MTTEEIKEFTELDGQKRLQAVMDLAAKTGRLLMSQDVYDAIKYVPNGAVFLSGIEIQVLPFLSPGTIMAVDMSNWLALPDL